VNQREDCLGFAYVVISLVKELSGVRFKGSFGLKRVESVNSKDRDLDCTIRNIELL
jgi:hypothetical protein